MEGRAIRVMIVDDHEAVRRGLSTLLQAAGDISVCGEAESVSQAERVQGEAPDVAIVDLRLGDGSGIDVSRQFRARWPHVAVVMLTGASETEARAASVAAGAAGYLVKQLGACDVVGTVRTVARGENLLQQGRQA